MNTSKALLLTDVVDSTRLAQQLGEVAVAALWAGHDRVVRELLSARGGRELDKTDGMLLLFDSAAAAVDYALAYRHALSRMDPPLQARVGLHLGPVALRESRPEDVARGAKPLEVDGVAKATAARVMSVALGGQILLTGDALQALGTAAAPRTQSHGHWCLKGLAEPVELFEVGAADQICVPPPDGDKAYRVVRKDDLWLPVREIRHSLPAERDPFVGREPALAEIAQQLHAGARLLSVLGVGGTGKTRLVTHFGWTWLGEFPGGIWFCDLTTARTTAGVAAAVAQGLDVPLGDSDPVAQLGNAIAGRGPCLVIIDNVEQVVRETAATVGKWLDKAPQARFVMTTRELLGLPGERVLALEPLPVDDGVTLFRHRAEAVAPCFKADDEQAIAPLVRLLDGLPLAIELAAARVRVMSPRQLLLRMGERFNLLTSKGSRVDRQATMRTTLDWSWDLLTRSEQAALAQLSVFEGGFTLESAEAVLDLGGHEPQPWVVDVIGSLVDKSLVRHGGKDRFDLLATVQAYATEQLQIIEGHPGIGTPAFDTAQRRHAVHFAGLGVKRALEARCAELDNLVVACRRAVALNEGELAAGALDGAWSAMLSRGPYGAGLPLAKAVCAMPSLNGRAAALALRVQMSMHVYGVGLGQAHELHERALAAAVAADDLLCVAAVTELMGYVHLQEGRLDESRNIYIEVERMAHASGDHRIECRAIWVQGHVDFYSGCLPEAEAHCERALRLSRQLEEQRMQAGILCTLTQLLGDAGRPDAAMLKAQEALALAREIGDRRVESDSLHCLGTILLQLGRFKEASAVARDSLALDRQLGALMKQGGTEGLLARLHEAMAEPVLARGHFETAIAIARETGDRSSECEHLPRLALLHARQGRPVDAMRCLDETMALLRATADPMGLANLQCCRA
jgi:predicted ATPase/class 3 adenylate cyclase